MFRNTVAKRKKLPSVRTYAQTLGSLFVNGFAMPCIGLSLRCTSSSPANELVIQYRVVPS